MQTRSKTLKTLKTQKILSKRKFGLVQNEYRGDDKTKLFNPPIELDDHYNWIRDDTRSDPNILTYIDEENTHTDIIMEPHKELVELLYNEAKSYVCGSYDTFAYKLNNIESWEYFRRYDETKDYPSYWRKRINKTTNIYEYQMLLDVNILALNKSQCGITSFGISPGHKYISYGVDWNGSEKYEFVLVELTENSQNIINIPIPPLAYCSYFWANSNTIYYLTGDDTNRLCQLWVYHLDSLIHSMIYEELDTKYSLDVELSANEQFIIISSSDYDSNCCKYIDLKNPDVIVDFIPRKSNVKYSIDWYQGFWYIHTNINTDDWEILKLDYKDEPIWTNTTKFISLQSDIYINSFELFEKFIIFGTKINGNIYLNIIDYDKTSVAIINHCENEIISWNEYIQKDSSNIKSSHVYTIVPIYNCIYSTEKLIISFSSMIEPTLLVEYNINTLDYIQIYSQKVHNYSSELYENKRIWVEQEGTKLGIPVSLVYRKDLVKFDGTNPIYMYGYGAYGSTINPSFNRELLPILDRGYIHATCHVRGGSFLGYSWYEDGKMEKKINTFKDFIRCAEYFAESKICDPTRIIIEGGSAGGLLVGACITMRPDLFWIGIPIVPFVDVLNTMSDSSIPLTKEEWTQWGNPNEINDFDIISKYCPYYNVKHTSYPHMYCTAGLHDPRVPYWEILKLVAKIREYKENINSIQIVRVDMNSGHFGGSSRFKSIRELAEKYAFVLTRLSKI